MYKFDRDISLRQLGEKKFDANISPDWSVNNNPNGGYLMALLANAVLQHADMQWITIFTAAFLSRCVPGPATATVDSLGKSTRFERWTVELSQKRQKKIHAVCTLTDRNKGADQVCHYEAAPPDLPKQQECVEFPALPGYTIFQQMEVLLDPACAGWLTTGKLVARSEHRGWIRFRDGRPFDMLSALLVVDSFPPPILASQGMVAWVPTLEMSVNVRELPATEWLKCVFRSRFLGSGIVEEDGTVWDENGTLVAISRQVAQFRKTG